MPPREVSRKRLKKSSRKRSKKNLKMPSAFCVICKRNFRNKILLNKHSAKHHFFRHCPNCPKTFQQTRRFICHLRSHLEHHPCECKNCMKKFNQKENLDLKAEEKSSKKFSCHRCGEEFAHLALLNRHRLAHNGPPYPCYECDAVFSNLPDVLVHSRNHVHRCFLCTKEVVAFPSNMDLVNHMYIVHRPEENDPAENEAIDTCEPCVSTGAVNLEDSASDGMEDLLSSDLESDSDLDTNYQTDAVETVYNLKRKDKFICFICFDLYPSCDLLKSHMKAHSWYPCNSCPRFFADAETLIKHECTVAQVPSFRCEKCKSVDDISEVNVNALQSIAPRPPKTSIFGFTNYTDVAQRNSLITFIHNIKSQKGPIDSESSALIGFHIINLKIILKYPTVTRLFSRECIRDLEELYSELQDLIQNIVVFVKPSSAQ